GRPGPRGGDGGPPPRPRRRAADGRRGPAARDRTRSTLRVRGRYRAARGLGTARQTLMSPIDARTRAVRSAVSLVVLLTLVSGCFGRGSSSHSHRATWAKRLIMWTKCSDVVGLTDAQLDTWHSRGIGGFVCQIQHLRGLGGEQAFSGDPNSSLGG